MLHEVITLTDRYEVHELVGRGPHASVHRATDEHGTTVALKTYDALAAFDTGFVTSFRREARQVQRVHDQHVLPVLDYGHDQGSYYRVTEFAVGGAITAHASLEVICAALQQAASGLAALHLRGLLHRNLKPANIVLRESGDWALVDATPDRQAGGEAQSSDDISVETLAYLSPEQILGDPVTPSSDVYSLGAILYDLSTGRLPFDALDPLDRAVEQVEHTPLLPTVLNPAISPDLERVILRAMAKEPRARHFSAVAFADDLAACQPTISVSERMGARQAGHASSGLFSRLWRGPVVKT